MKAEIISIGDEMTNGQRLDTNSRWLSQQLADLGVITTRHTTVSDDLVENVDVFASAAKRADLVILTGGLGPTKDDLTREALAQAFDAPLELNNELLAHIEAMFTHRNRSMPESNQRQAWLPRGSQAIANLHGTAPGIDMVIPREGMSPCRLFALPGVPAEMTQMWASTVRPRVLELIGPDRRPLRFHTIKVFGIGESDVESKLPDLMRRDRHPRVGITVSRATISLRIAAQAGSDHEFAQVIDPTVKEIETALGSLIFGADEDELEHAVIRLLQQAQMTLAVLEIGPSALAAQWLLSASLDTPPGTATVLSCDSVAHAASALSRIQPQGTGRADELITFPALATCLKQTLKADIGMAFGTYAAPSELQNDKPSAEVNVAIAGPNAPVELITRTIIGHPDILNDRIAKTALDALRLLLIRRADLFPKSLPQALTNHHQGQ